MTEEFYKPLDLSLFEGSPSGVPLHYKFNTLRGFIHDKCNECWECSKLTSCTTVSKIFRCNKVKFITDKFKKEDFL